MPTLEWRHYADPGMAPYCRPVTVKNNLWAYQSVVSSDRGLDKLVRAIVTHGEIPLRVVTVYQTSKITKYWRAS